MKNKFHNVLFGISILPALLVMPAVAADANTDGVAFLFGDVTLSNMSTIDNAAFGGRRMEWTNINGVDKYRNEFPKYQMIGRSFELSESVAYVGPVTLTLRELTDNDHLAYNWADDGVDTDLAARAGVDFGNSQEEIYAAVAGVIGAGNAQYTAPGVIAFANRDNSKTAGAMNFNGVTATIDGATVNANSINVTDGSTLTFVKQDPSVLSNAARFYTNVEDIDSDGKTNLTANTINVNSSRFIVNSDAELTVNAQNGTTFTSGSSAGNGGAIYNVGTLETTGDTLFGNNSVSVGNGGAIFNGSAGELTLGATTMFNENVSGNYGGAISNEGVLNANNLFLVGNSAVLGGGVLNLNEFNVQGTSVFTGNMATTNNGGAIYNEGEIVFVGATTFGATGDINKNTASLGGAIYNDHSGNSGLAQATVTFKDVATFENNVASTQGGAIVNATGDTMTFEKLAVFRNNNAQQNGNIVFNSGTMIFQKGITLQNNGSGRAGHGANNSGFDNNGGIVSIYGGDITVTDNIAGSGAGFNGKVLLGAYQDGTRATGADAVNNIMFRNNTAVGNAEGYNSTAGALYAMGGTKLYAENITFDNNSNSNLNGNAAYGGAVAIQGGTLDIIGSANNVFTNNHSDATNDVESKMVKFGGGAIQVRGNTGGTTLTVGEEESNNTFSSNVSAMHGGAIHVRAEADTDVANVNLNGTTTFSANNAALNGGAISNSPVSGTSEFTINGDSTFTGNIAGGLGGAVYNSGTLTFNGVATFTDNKANNIANDIYNTGTIAFNGNTTLNGGITGNGTLTVAAGKTLNIGTASIEQGILTLNGTLIATVRDGNAQLNVSDTFDGTGSMKLALGGAGTYHVFGNKVFSGVDVSSSVYDLTWSEDGKDLTAVLKSAEDIAAENGVSAESAATLTNLSNSSSAKLNDLAVKIQETLANGTDEDKHAVEHATAALNPEKASVVQSVTTSVQNTVASLASNRMTMPAVGRNGGDFDLTSGGVWVQGLFNKSKLNEQFNSYTRGVAVGLDGTFDKVLMFGVGYALNHSDVTLNVRDTEIDSHTLFVYGQYKPNNWYVNTTLNYTLSDYEESSVVLGGVNVSADYTTTAFGAQIATGYGLNHGVTPEFTLRYLHVNGETYTNSHDVQNKLDGADYLTAMLGTKYNAAFNINRNLTLHPEVRYAVKYDLISDKSSSVVTMPGVAAYVVNGDRLSRVGGEFGLGLGMKYRGLDMSVNYDIDVRQDYTSQTGMLKFRYNF